MISSFAKSIHVSPPVILGRRVRPFSAYHQITLEAFGNPLFTGERTAECADVIEAWLICCDGYGDDKKTFRRFGASRLFRWYIRQRLLLGGWGIIESQLREYINSYSFAPEVWLGKEAAFSKVPVAWHMVAVMLSKGLGLTEAMNLPLCELVCLKLALGELEGVKIAEGDLARAREALASDSKEPSRLIQEIVNHGS